MATLIKNNMINIGDVTIASVFKTVKFSFAYCNFNILPFGNFYLNIYS